MAKAGDELVNPVTGLRTVFRKTAPDAYGELLKVDWIGEPGWTTGPGHVTGCPVSYAGQMKELPEVKGVPEKWKRSRAKVILGAPEPPVRRRAGRPYVASCWPVPPSPRVS